MQCGRKRFRSRHIDERPRCGTAGTTIAFWQGMVALIEQLNQLMCRHDFVRRVRPGRVWLECTECGYESVGIDVSRGRLDELELPGERHRQDEAALQAMT